MGNSLDTPVKCPLCNELTQDPVKLKCNHHFCRRCIGDLWSGTQTGPYRCPEFRCKTVYQTLPFDGRFKPPAPSRRAHSRSAAGTSSNDERNVLDPLLRRPSLSRLLGKRKAGPSVPEQPDAKRSAVESHHQRPDDTETPSASPAAEPEPPRRAETPENEARPDPAPCESGDGSPSSECSDTREVPLNGNETPPGVSVLAEQEVITLDDSESSSEVDTCDAPLFATPEKKAQATGAPVSPTHPTRSEDAARVSPPAGGGASPVHAFPRPPAAASGSPGGVWRASVPCHYCPRTGCQPAVNTCLVCGASMCEEHLRPHLDSPVFQNHTLIPPTEDISLWRCPEHQEINRIYCQQCRVCVCTVCTLIGSHKDHACVSIREAERELRGNLKKEIRKLQVAEQTVKNRVQELTKKKETFREVLSEALAGVKQQYAAVREALEQEEQSALQCVTAEEESVVGGLEEKLRHLRGSLQSIQTGLHTLEGLADAKGDRCIKDQAFIVEYTRIAQMTSGVGDGVEQFETPEEVNRARLRCLQSWTEKRLDAVVISMPGNDGDLYRLLYGTTPCLDPDTAHPKLQLSDNNRTVSYSEVQQAYTAHEARFTSFPQVLAARPLEAGRWYWEVSVSVDSGRWKVGLCEGGMERKGPKDNARLGFNGQSWCLACDKKKVEALHDKACVPLSADGLQRLGVFVDLEEGLLSFFSVTPGGSLALMHSYKQRFNGPLYPALSVSKTQLAICDFFPS